MEDDLDAISLGEAEWLPYLRRFYFGANAADGLEKLLQAEIDARQVCTIPLGEDSEGRLITVRVGRYGPYLERGEDRGTIPADLAPDQLTLEKAEELLSLGSGPIVLGEDPESGKPVYLKNGRFGFYVQLGDPEGKTKAKMKSVMPSMDPEQLELDQALALLRLPRTLGPHPEDGEPVVADFGRYGSYIKWGSETRSLESEEDVFSVDVPKAVELLKQEKRGRRSGPKVLRELGNHPESEQPIRLLDGRFGPYVTDGNTNASLPRGTDPDSVDLERAVELIREREARGPTKRGRKKKATKKKASKKKTAKKKTTRKKTTRKKTTRKKASKKATGSNRSSSGEEGGP